MTACPECGDDLVHGYALCWACGWHHERVVDLGLDHFLRFTCWEPDRDLNPQYDGIPDVERYGAIIDHRIPRTGEPCSGAITFASEVQARIEPNRPSWTVEQWEPLTISPSVLCRFDDGLGECGDHGFVRAGRWVPA